VPVGRPLSASYVLQRRLSRFAYTDLPNQTSIFVMVTGSGVPTTTVDTFFILFINPFVDIKVWRPISPAGRYHMTGGI
jgi:hypothetical protein